ncbi:MAG: helix-turn-helix transcriptional regulator, partial [Oscillibacter sp.]
TQNTLTGYESGRRNPSSSVVNNICKEFGVNEDWLRTGNGEMFVPAPCDALDMLAREYGLTHGDYILIEKFISMKPQSRQVLVDYIVEVSAAYSNTVVPASPYDPADPGSVDVDAETASYRRELEDQKKVAAKSSALGGQSGGSSKKMA